jgi:ubiquinone/menaquinone biosynthesis C-methylase UbiE
MLARAYPKRTPALASRLRFYQMNVDQRLLFPDHYFDHAIAISVLQAVSDPHATCREVWRVLKPGGSFVVLHVAKPAYHELPLIEEIRLRLRYLKRKRVGTLGLVAIKSWVERHGGTRYWSVAELRELLEGQHFILHSIDTGPPLVAVMRKPSNAAPEPDD